MVDDLYDEICFLPLFFLWLPYGFQMFKSCFDILGKKRKLILLVQFSFSLVDFNALGLGSWNLDFLLFIWWWLV